MRVAAILIFVCGLRAQPAPLFDFHSGFWVNLHQFLYAQAADAKSPRSGSPEWQQAVAYYRRELKHDLLQDDMAAINNRLAHTDAAEKPDVESKLAAILEGAAAEYRKTWWAEHDAASRAWMAAMQPLLARYGADMKRDIAGTFQTSWPSVPVRTEVAAKAGWAGAYTTENPTLITVSSTNATYQGLSGVEMLFHEASHSLDSKVNAALTAELKSRKMLFRRRAFGHAVLFYTAGEIARRHLGDYQPVGIKEGILERGWPGSLAVLEKDWKPYLDGKTTFADAVQALVTDYGEPQK